MDFLRVLQCGRHFWVPILQPCASIPLGGKILFPTMDDRNQVFSFLVSFDARKWANNPILANRICKYDGRPSRANFSFDRTEILSFFLLLLLKRMLLRATAAIW